MSSRMDGIRYMFSNILMLLARPLPPTVITQLTCRKKDISPIWSSNGTDALFDAKRIVSKTSTFQVPNSVERALCPLLGRPLCYSLYCLCFQERGSNSHPDRGQSVKGAGAAPEGRRQKPRKYRLGKRI